MFDIIHINNTQQIGDEDNNSLIIITIALEVSSVKCIYTK